MVKNLKKQYETPNRAWNEERIQREDELRDNYGLKNKEEIYKAYSKLRNFRREARKLVGEESSEAEDVLNKANRLGLVKSDAELTDLLTLQVEDILNRRLQTAVDRRGHADSPKHARQLVTHGRVKVNGEKVNIPGYMLTTEEEKTIEVEEPSEPDETEASEEDEESEETEESGNTEENEEVEE
ncbi:MAG: 30S ribosomal protein S4 [Candidatus Nanohaloarchaea archaeon]